MHKNQTSKSNVLPRNTVLTAPVDAVPADAVERVLEHISSPFRWELLEDTPVKPKIRKPKNLADLK